MSDTPPQLSPPISQRSSPIMALCLGFLPAAVALLLLSFQPQVGAVLLCFMTAASVVCCLVSSILLFKRGTVISMIGGLLLLMLNGFIAFCCGCFAIMVSMNH